MPSSPSPPTARVVHVSRSAFDVYIGRGRSPTSGRPGSWGNPWTVKDHGRRGCMESFLAMVEECVASPGWLERTRRELGGQRLGCWCAPELCHGDILARLANGMPWPAVRSWALDRLAALESGELPQLVLFPDPIELERERVGDPA